MVKIPPSNAGGMSSFPGRWTKIPHAVQYGQKILKKKKFLNHIPSLSTEEHEYMCFLFELKAGFQNQIRRQNWKYVNNFKYLAYATELFFFSKIFDFLFVKYYTYSTQLPWDISLK